MMKASVRGVEIAPHSAHDVLSAATGSPELLAAGASRLLRLGCAVFRVHLAYAVIDPGREGEEAACVLRADQVDCCGRYVGATRFIVALPVLAWNHLTITSNAHQYCPRFPEPSESATYRHFCRRRRCRGARYECVFTLATEYREIFCG